MFDLSFLSLQGKAEIMDKILTDHHCNMHHTKMLQKIKFSRPGISAPDIMASLFSNLRLL